MNAKPANSIEEFNAYKFVDISCCSDINLNTVSLV